MTIREALAWTVLVSPGCAADNDAPSDGAGPQLLAAIDGWQRVTDPNRDVFAPMRPMDAPCDEAGLGIEEFGLSFEVKTDLCDYATVAQAIRADIAAGDIIRIRAWHDTLQAPEPSEGYVGIALDGEVIWEVSVPIPGPYEAINADVVADGDHAEGAELQYHVHNHGANSWNLLDVQRVPQGGR